MQWKERIKVKVIVLCALGQLLCSVNSAGSPIARNVMCGDIVDCQITSLSGCHKFLCQDPYLEVRQ